MFKHTRSSKLLVDTNFCTCKKIVSTDKLLVDGVSFWWLSQGKKMMVINEKEIY